MEDEEKQERIARWCHKNAQNWIAQVEEIISMSPENEGRFLRVATPLLKAEPEVYIPQYLSLGPYYHSNLMEKKKEISALVVNYGMSKVQSAATFWRKEGRQWNNFGDIVEKIYEKKHEIEEFYNLQKFNLDRIKFIQDGYGDQNWDVMMAVDLSFLLFFLYMGLDCEYGELMRRLTRLNDVSIECDILKLENQIPLSVLGILWEETLCFQRDKLKLDKMLRRTCNRLSPFLQDSDRRETEAEIEAEIIKQPHLLGCLHKFVSPTLDMEAVIDHERGPTLWESAQHTLEMVVAAVFTLLHVRHPTNILNSYNAQVLEKAGIKFKLFCRKPYGIWFNIYSATLYLPQINIVSEVQTEVLFKNMLALEFNDAARAFSVTRYVGLMSHLIGTPEDVRVLTKSQVIHRPSLAVTDEKIARMWNGMCHPIFTGHYEPPKNLENALLEVLTRKYYMGIMKWVLWGFYWVPIKERLSKPGKGIALLVGILILVMTAIQTYCSLLSFLRTY